MDSEMQGEVVDYLRSTTVITDDVLVWCIKLLVFFFNCKCKKRIFSWVIPCACFCQWTLTLWLPAIVFCRLEKKSQLLLVWWGKQSPSSLLMRYHVDMQDAKNMVSNKLIRVKFHPWRYNKTDNSSKVWCPTKLIFQALSTCFKPN